MFRVLSKLRDERAFHDGVAVPRALRGLRIIIIQKLQDVGYNHMRKS